MKESARWKETWKALSATGVRLFRNNVGSAYQGKGLTLKRGQSFTAKGGERLIFSPRLIIFGLFKGSADGVGCKSITITPDMVGQKIAAFVSVEQKTDIGEATDEQLIWYNNVRRAGGIAIITKDPERVVEEFENGR